MEERAGRQRALIQSREATFGLMGSLRTHPPRRARENKRQSCEGVEGEHTLPLPTGDAHASTLRAGWSNQVVCLDV